jgi:hypothetical protein
MKTSHIIFSALLLVSCTSTHHTGSLTADQAEAVSIQLANEKASTIYHCQPFRDDGQPARVVAGLWVWTELRGCGQVDLQATIELAMDGSTHSVDVQLLDCREY